MDLHWQFFSSLLDFEELLMDRIESVGNALVSVCWVVRLQQYIKRPFNGAIIYREYAVWIHDTFNLILNLADLLENLAAP